MNSTLTLVKQKIDRANRTHIARGVGVTREYVSQVLGGKKEPSLPTAAKLALELGITLDGFYRVWSEKRAA